MSSDWKGRLLWRLVYPYLYRKLVQDWARETQKIEGLLEAEKNSEGYYMEIVYINNGQDWHFYYAPWKLNGFMEDKYCRLYQKYQKFYIDDPLRQELAECHQTFNRLTFLYDILVSKEDTRSFFLSHRQC